MAVFFESAPSHEPTRRALRSALAQQPPPADELDARADALAAATEGTGVSLKPRLSSFAVAAALLAVFAALALWAESQHMAKATDQLWTAFQTILGVIVGFLGGEASGAAMGK